MSAPIPKLDPRPIRTIADMPMAGMEMAADAPASHAGHGAQPPKTRTAGHDMPGMEEARTPEMDMSAVDLERRLHPGPMPPPRTLTYADLRAAKAYADRTPPEREITLRLTGSMRRYYWSIDGRKWPGATPLKVRYGERVRVHIVNDTMMEHPMHLHGMWMDLVSADGSLGARKHTVVVGPNQTVTADVTIDALKTWAFHCHILFHAATGMMTTLQVAEVIAP